MTTANNFEIAKNKAQAFEAALNAAKDWSGIPGLDNFNKQLLDNRAKLLELSRLMTPEQFMGAQESLNKINQQGNQIAELTNKVNKANEAFQNFKTVNIEDFFKKESAENFNKLSDDIVEDVNKVQTAFAETEKLSDTNSNFVTKFITNIYEAEKGQVKDFEEPVIKAVASIQTLMDQLGKLEQENGAVWKNLSDPVSEGYFELEEKFKDLQNLMTPKNLENMNAETILNNFRSFFEQLSNFAKQGNREVTKEYQALVDVMTDPKILTDIANKRQELERSI